MNVCFLNEMLAGTHVESFRPSHGDGDGVENGKEREREEMKNYYFSRKGGIQSTQETS